MSHVADRFVVLLDANVLYPYRMRDALLRFAEAGLFRARWSAEILDEWQRSLLRNKPDIEASIHQQIDAMDRAFPEARVTGYEALMDSLDLPDPDDRHVLAAAIGADAEHIVTENLKDFPEAILAPYGLCAVTADDFLQSNFEYYPAQAVGALRTMRRAYRNPAFTADEFIFDLQSKGLPKTASLLKPHIDAI